MSLLHVCGMAAGYELWSSQSMSAGLRHWAAANSIDASWSGWYGRISRERQRFVAAYSNDNLLDVAPPSFS